jgi:hypothetical protein
MKYQTGLLDKLGEYPIGGQGHFMTLLFQTHSHTDERQYIIATSIGQKQHSHCLTSAQNTWQRAFCGLIKLMRSALVCVAPIIRIG